MSRLWGGLPLGLGLVMEDRPTELLCVDVNQLSHAPFHSCVVCRVKIAIADGITGNIAVAIIIYEHLHGYEPLFLHSQPNLLGIAHCNAYIKLGHRLFGALVATVPGSIPLQLTSHDRVSNHTLIMP